MSTTALLVFAKSPVPGTVKTRLMPGLSASQAASLYRRMLERVLGAAVGSRLGPVTLCCAPDASCPVLRDTAARHGTALASQRGAGLGERMRDALGTAVADGGRALLFGSDCPDLDARVLRRADASLRAGADVVLVPAVDGGYVLVGARCPCGPIFEDVPWGTNRVMAVTRARLRAHGLEAEELPPLRDVDRIQDLDLVPSGL